MGSMFGGGSSSQTTETAPWKPSQSHLENILGEMGNWYESAKDTGYISQTGDLNGIYGEYLNKLQQTNKGTQENTDKLMGMGMSGLENTQAFYDKILAGGGNITSEDITNMAGDFIDNDLLQSQIDAANTATARNLYENQLTGIDRAAVDSGNMGSSRAGVAAAVAERGANETMANTAATMRGNAYNNALNQAQSVLERNLATDFAAAQGAGSTANNAFQMGTNWAGGVQNGLSGYLTQAQLQAMLQAQGQADLIGQRDYLANILGQYSNIATGIGGMGGTSTQSGGSGGVSSFDKLVQMGMMGASMMSDKRLKKNVKVIGKEGDVEIVSWDWNDLAKEEFGLEGSDRGVIAQDILETHPNCVDIQDGFYCVNYDLLSRELGKSIR